MSYSNRALGFAVACLLTVSVGALSQPLLPALAAPPEAPPAQAGTVPVTGIVFLDYNGDGFMNTTGTDPYALNANNTVAGVWPIDVRVAGITVTAYMSGTLDPAAATQTNASGAYTLSLTPGYSYLIIFSGYDDLGYKEGPRGKYTISSGQLTPAPYGGMDPSVGNGLVLVNLTASTPTSLRSKVNFGLVRAEDYASVAPRVAHSSATASSSPTSLASVAVYREPIQNSWTGGVDLLTRMKELADRNQVGAVWGLAYQSASDRLFASSMVRRYIAPLGTDTKSDSLFLINNNRPADPNANPSAPALIGRLSLSSLGLDFGPLPTRSPAYLDTGDRDTFGLVGKRGIGGIDLFSEGYQSVLYLANLYDRNIYGLKVGVPATTALTAGDVVNVPAGPWASDADCAGKGPARPWAVKVKNRSLFVGAVCTGENATTPLYSLNAGVTAAAAGWSGDGGQYSLATARVVDVEALDRTNTTCALTDLGGVVCWGYNGYGQLGIGTTADSNRPGSYVAGLTRGVTKLSSGNHSMCALTDQGSVWCWGYNGTYQLGDQIAIDRWAPVRALGAQSGVTDVSAGVNFTCAVQNGAVKCWGYNTNGVLGNGTTTNSGVAVTAIVSSAVQVSASADWNTCARMADGTVRCWGYGGSGGNGDGTTTNRLTPVTVLVSPGVPLTNVVQVEGAAGANCAVRGDGTVWCWGRDGVGQLGNADGIAAIQTYPSQVVNASNVPLTGIKQVSGGDTVDANNNPQGHFCAASTAGNAYCWGWNAYGQLGDGTTTTRFRAVTVLDNTTGVTLTGVSKISAGNATTCAVITDGTLKCWGANGNGNIGIGATGDKYRATSSLPVAPNSTSYIGQPAPYSAARLSQSQNITYSVPFTNGSYEMTAFFYSDAEVSLDLSVEGQPVAPQRVYRTPTSPLSVTIATTAYSTCVITPTGGVECWGYGGNGQLGNGGTATRDTPVPVSGLSNVVQLAGGARHMCALTASGGMWCWGANGSGQLGDNSTTQRNTPVQVSGLITGVMAIGAGSYHSCAILAADGRVKCWGYNSYGSLGDNTTTQRNTPVDTLVAAGVPLTGAVQVQGGTYHTCSLQRDGSMRCWGHNNQGQLGRGFSAIDQSTDTRLANTIPVGMTSGVTTIGVTARSTCAVQNGGLKCWGYNAQGQVGDGATTNRNTPTQVYGLSSGVAQVRTLGTDDYSSACAVLTTGGAKCWGWNSHGKIGDGAPNGYNQVVPVDVVDLQSGIVDLAAGASWDFTCAMTTGGGVKCWGYNADYELGLPLNTVDRLQQRDLPGTRSIYVPANTQTILRQDVTIRDGVLNLVITRTSGARQTAFINGLQLREKLVGPALVYAYPLNADGTPVTGASWTNPLSMTLDYARSARIDDDTCSGLGLGTRKSAGWNAWADRYNDAWHSTVSSQQTLCGPAGRRLPAWPQPMLVDLEFGPDNAIALGFADRFSYQMKESGMYPNNATTYYKTQAHPPGSADTVGVGYYSPAYAGDVVCASGSGAATGAWTVEAGAVCNGRTAAGGSTNADGVAEYFQDYYNRLDTVNRWEPARGATYQIPGAQSVAVNTAFPYATSNYWSVGATSYSLLTGASLRVQTVFGNNNYTPSDTQFETGSSALHDYELMSVPAPVEIGDRVWKDVNGNGIQDPDEPGLAGVVVTLIDPYSNTATATTDAAGYFSFSSDPDPTPTGARDDNANVSTGSRIYGLDGKSAGEVNLLIAGSGNYTLSIALNQASLLQGSERLMPTNPQINVGVPPAQSGAPDNDPRDSDGAFTDIGGQFYSVLTFLGGFPGQNDSTFDFGFVLPNLVIGDRVWNDANNNGKADVGETGIPGVKVELYYDSDNNMVFSPGKDRYITTTTTAVDGTYAFTKQATASYIVVITSSNFITGGALYNKLPSYQIGKLAADGNSDRNDVSHGRRAGALGAGGYVFANRLTLAAGTEPTNDGDGNTGNLTLDFGFFNGTPIPNLSAGDVGGAIFIDSDYNGLMASSEDLLAGVVVNVYDAANTLVATTTSGLDGRYVLTGLYSTRPATTTLRYEFVNLPDGFGSGPDGTYGITNTAAITGSGGSVRFFSGATANLNYGVTDLYASSCATPYLAMCVMYGGPGGNGNPLVPGTVAATSGNRVANGGNVVSWDYYASGFRTGSYLPEATGADVGAVWGLGADKAQGRLYAAAVVKRSVGLGPLGLGGIYRMTARGADAPERMMDLQALGVNLGSIPSNAERFKNYDDPKEVGAAVGRVGMGGLDLDEKGRTLFVTNLYQKTVVIINVDRKTAMGGANPVTGGDILAQTPIPMPACVGGEGRPWGMAVRNGFVYAGVVCDASVSQNRNDLQGFVYKYDIAARQWVSGTANPLVQFPLNYKTGQTSPGYSQKVTLGSGEVVETQDYFLPWLDEPPPGYLAYRTPVIADIDFDDDGSMVAQIIDRRANQVSPYVQGVSNINAGGDTLRFCNVDGNLITQGLPGCPIAVRNKRGLNGGVAYLSQYWHSNKQVGGIAILPGMREVASGEYDPGNWYQQGVERASSLTGYKVGGGWQVSPSSPGVPAGAGFSKGSGVGDLEVICEPGPLEIGNRVWYDPNVNGIQDANEGGLTGVVVSLYRPGPDGRFWTTDDVLVATTTTNLRGEYIFNDRTDANPDRDILALTEYQVRIDTTQSILKPYLLTTRDSLMTGGAQPSAPGLEAPQGELSAANYADLRDSDAGMVGKFAVITLTTGLYKDNNHSYDIGFLRGATLGNRVWLDINADGVPNAGEYGVPNVKVALYDALGRAVMTTTSDASGYYTFSMLYPMTYTVGFAPAKGYGFTNQTAPVVAKATDGGALMTENAGVAAMTAGSGIYAIAANSAPVPLAEGETNLNVIAGLSYQGGVGDTVWEDLNANGIQDSGEPGLSGVTLDLYRNGVVISTTTTDADGNYSFGISQSGAYSLVVTSPAGYSISPPNVVTGTTDFADSDLLANGAIPIGSIAAGTQDPSFDAGLYRTASLGDLVWADANANGIRDPGEAGIAGVQVVLYNALNRPVFTTTTNASGNYTFTGLVPGDYAVKFTVPAGYAVSPLDANGNLSDTVDSDADPLTGRAITTTLISGQNDPTWDLGLYQPATLGNRVWLDVNGDGIQNTSEISGVSGVTVTLYNAAGAVVSTTNTTATGYYTFANLPPGDYAVGIALPAGYTLSALDANLNLSDTVDSDVSPVTYRTPLTTLSNGEVDLSWDMGLYQPVKVGDYVWVDANVDGQQTAGELGAQGVVAALYSAVTNQPYLGATGQPLTTTTDANGLYLFDNLLPGNYFVVFDLSTLPYGYAVTTQNTGSSATDSDASPLTGKTGATGVLNSGQQNLTLDMGVYATASVGNYVWMDADQDGIQDADEGAMVGVTVKLYDVGGNVVATTTTDGAGLYVFGGLKPGTYSVGFTKPAGYTFSPQDATYDADGDPATAAVNDDTLDSDANVSTGRTANVTLAAGDSNLTLDAGLYYAGGLGDRVWNDQNANGIQDSGESGLAGVPLTLTTPAGQTFTTVTDASGFYNFSGLADGTFTVTVGPIAGFVPSPQYAGNSTAADSDLDPATRAMIRTLAFGESYPYLDAGFYQPVTVGNFVWYDDDVDGYQDAGEAGVSGVSVGLFDGGTGLPVLVNGQPLTTTTSITGLYRFDNLLPGNYFVVFDLASLPAEYVVTRQDAAGSLGDATDSDADPATGRTASTGYLPGGAQNLSLDMGIYKPGKLGDFVWYDTNRDGIQDPGEKGAPNVQVVLYGLDGVTPMMTTTTDATGRYTFTNLLPGTYSLAFTMPPNFGLSPQNQGADDAVDSDADPATFRTAPAVLTPGENDPSWDAGIYFTGSLGDRVWLDANGNGRQDVGEGGVPYALLMLSSADGDSFTVADAGGYYAFYNLPPGAYTVTVFPPAGHALSRQNQGIDESTDSDASPFTFQMVYTLALNENYPLLDVGMYLPATLGDTVWLDADADGLQDVGETGIAGVAVTLYDGSGVVTNTTTDAAGRYTFTNLLPGDYSLGFTAPAGYQISPQNALTDSMDAYDSDVNPVTGRTITTTLVSGESDLTWDLGLYQRVSLGSWVWFDGDADGQQDAGEPGIAGAQVVLLNAAGQPAITTTTDATGAYTFTNLDPGNYIAQVSPPAGYTPTLTQTADPNNDSNTDSNIASSPSAGVYRSGVVTLTSGGEPTSDGDADANTNLSVDFGFMGVKLGDFVWLDADGNGQQDAGEAGVAGVTVTLQLPYGLVITTTTNANGFYSFTNVAPSQTQTVTFLAPAGMALTTANAGNDATDSDPNASTGVAVVTMGITDNWTLDAGLIPGMTLGNFVWFDADADGQQDVGEPGIAGAAVALFNADGVTAARTITGLLVVSQTTDASGLYTFTDVPPGGYVVRISPPAGYAPAPTQTADPNNDSNTDSNIASTVSPNVYASGIITLTSGLEPAGGIDGDGTNGNLTVDFGFIGINLGNAVWLDANGNGQQDAGEPPVAGVTVTLQLPSGAVMTTTSNASGAYTFTNLAPNQTYTLTFIPPAGYALTAANLGDDATDSDPDISGVAVVALTTTDVVTVDAGLAQPMSLGNFVWFDRNADGQQDAGEPGIAGAVVELFLADGVTAARDVTGALVVSQTTGAGGRYTFTNLMPGGYVARVTPPAGYTPSLTQTAAPNTDSNTDSNIASTVSTGVYASGIVTLTVGGEPASGVDSDGPNGNLTVDFGFVGIRLGDYAWLDVNLNGQQDGGEAPAAVTVTLKLPNGAVVTTTTDATGRYTFTNLAPSQTYTLTFTPPPGYTFTAANNGDDATDSDVDASGVAVVALGTTDNATIDAGVVPPASLGNWVWYDNDKDGIQDPGELGVPGVQVVLYDVNDAPVATTTTGATGYYTFTDLLPGTYSVGFTLPPSFGLSPQGQGADGAANSDPDPLTSRTAPTELTAGENDATWDAGIYFTGSLGDRIWLDTNANGVQDGGEVGLAGVTLTLTMASGDAVTTTDAGGYYAFNDLPPGVYTVTLQPPAGYAVSPRKQGSGDTSDSDADPSTLTMVYTLGVNENYPLLDAGLYVAASLGDFVWLDVNADGLQDAGESGLVGVVVTLYDRTGAVVTNTTTDAAGLYTFTSLVPGDYSVGFTAPAGYRISPRDAGGFAGNDASSGGASDSDGNPLTGRTITTTLVSGENDLSWDLGLFQPVSLGDLVWFDADADGQQDAGEPGIAGAVVALFTADGVTAAQDVNGQPVVSKTTGASGLYSFTNLMPGAYVVRVTPPGGYAPTSIQVSDPNTDNNTDANIASTVSPGVYASGIVTLTVGGEPTGDGDADANTNWTVDFGFTGISLGNEVWLDANGNGQHDAGEAPVAGVTVTLQLPIGTVLTTTTNASGAYTFTNLAPSQTYTVTFIPPAGYALTAANSGNDATDSDPDVTTGVAVVALGTTDNLTLDAGLVQPMRLGNFVWFDRNADGQQDAGEPGIAGAVVKLFKADGVTAARDVAGALVVSQTTGAGGLYTFTNLPPGGYIVGVTPPAGYTPTLTQTADPNTDSNADSNIASTVSTGVYASGIVTLTVGGEPTSDGDADANSNLAVDVGFVGISLGDYVWLDVNLNGQQDAGEAPVAGVSVTLQLPDGAVLTATTNASGRYTFTNLAPSQTYTITFVPPDGYALTTANTGNDATDSDPDVSTGVAVLALGTTDNLTLDAGLVPAMNLGDAVWFDSDADGQHDPGEPGIAGAVVELFKADGVTAARTITGQLVVSQTTGADGLYNFVQVPPGGYVVRVKPPAGYSPTAGQVGDPNTNNNADSNVALTVTNGVYASGIVTLSFGLEPASDVDTDGTNGNLTVDFGFIGVNLGNYVWLDANGNGQQDEGEAPMADYSVLLQLPDGTALVAVTDASGYYTFTNLAPSQTYTVTFSPPDGYVLTLANIGDDATDSDANASGVAVVALGTADNGTVDAGMIPAMTLGDAVWLDVNRNGQKDAGEPGIAGAVVELFLANGVTPALRLDGQLVVSQTTDEAGTYKFTALPPGGYVVRVTPPAGYTPSPVQVSDPNTDIDSDSNIASTASPGVYASGIVTLTAGTEPPSNVDLDGANGNETVDFGFIGLSLGDYVWLDVNGNGQQDGGEAPLAGISVTLQLPNGTVWVTTTNVGGYYSYTNLAPNQTYTVTFIAPAGYALTAANSGNDATDSDPDGSGVVVVPMTTTDNLTVDAGLAQPMKLGDFVWFDSDADGQQDAGEPGIAGVVVRLFKADGVTAARDISGQLVAAQTTSASGLYSFTNLLPGGYVVGVTPPAGYSPSPGQVSDPNTNNNADSNIASTPSAGVYASGIVTLTIGGEPASAVDGDNTNGNLTVDFGFVGVKLGDYVWSDVNMNGQQDAGEAPLSGVTVTLRLPSGATRTATTGASGAYSFTNLPPSQTYTVAFSLPAGYTVTVANTGDDATDSDVNASGVAVVALGTADNLTVDAGLVALASLGNWVWYDNDKDGIQDPGELGVPGIQVTLYDVTGTLVATTTTSATGYYTFANLRPATYTVGFEMPPNFGLSPLNQGADDAVDSDADPETFRTAPTELTPGENDRTWDAGIYFTGSLGDRVWLDANANGIQDTGELGMAGVVLTLTNPGGATVNTTTDAGGYYAFNDLPPGLYTVTVQPPASYFLSPQNQGGSEPSDSDAATATFQMVYTLTLNENYPLLDTGMYRLASLGDFVWLDVNADGLQDAGETGIEGVAVTLYDAGGVVTSTTTDATGHYSFTHLIPGDYSVGFTAPAGYQFSPQNALADSVDAADSDANPLTGRTITTSLVSGENDPTWDLGLYRPVSLGDYVWLDANGNGQQDAGELPVAGVTVTLQLANGAVLITTTRASGTYTFANLGPNQTYTVTFTPPPGYTLTTPNIGDDASDSDADEAGVAVVALGTTDNTTIDAGLVQLMSLGNYVWYDTNADGQQAPNEPGLAGVVVALFMADGATPAVDVTGATVASQTTSLDGQYLFTNLAPGGYVVRVTPPSAFGPTQAQIVDPNTNSNTDSNIASTVSTGVYASGIVTLTAAAEPAVDVDGDGTNGNLTVDFGFYIKPTAIQLAQLRANRQTNGSVRVEWQSVFEQNALGYRVYRVAGEATSGSVPPGAVDVSGLVAARGAGAYDVTDASAAPMSRYSYYLVEFDLGGTTTTFGPVLASPLGGRAYLPIVSRPNP